MNVQPGLLAKKLGMTQLFDKDGARIPVTVLSVAGNTVTAHRTEERDGYTAVQIGFSDQKPSRMTKADLGRFKQAGVAPKRYVREFRVPADALEKFPVGQPVAVETVFPLSDDEESIAKLQQGPYVDVSGVTKGKGFQGVIKRYHMRGMKQTHGVHEVYRHGGSIGCRLTPGRVAPGKKMAGQMGNEIKTIQNLRVAKVMADEGLVLVHGAVPGPNQGVVSIRVAHKKALAAAHKANKGKGKK
ncbi:MAG: 50S ribosomal protein L3 [Myxococcota bacterium]